MLYTNNFLSNAGPLSNLVEVCKLYDRRLCVVCEFNRLTDYEAENKTITLTIPTQASIPVISIVDWIMFMHREVASGFNWGLSWNDDKNGFGSSGSLDFWMGLERLHLLTTSGSYRLRVEWQEGVTDKWLSVEYWTFYIDDEAAKYTLHVSGYVDGDDGRALYVCRKSFLTHTTIPYTRYKLINYTSSM